jgi:hypothetical protein
MRKRFNLVLLSLAAVSLSLPPSFAQEQQIFQDEQQMLRVNSNQTQQMENHDQQYRQEVQQADAQEQPYRLYVEQRIKALQKIRNAHGSPALSTANDKQFYALQQWPRKDEQTREQEQAHIRQLDKAIANLQNQTNATYSNLGASIQSMRENEERASEDDKFNQTMRMNMFNELQSEMGAASWGGSPTDGTMNSVGGRYGMQGGYGYSYGGGRRWNP